MKQDTLKEFLELMGKVMQSVTATDDTMTFITKGGRIFEFFHAQDCCESVYIDDICGDLKDLEGAPIVRAEEVSNDENSNPGGDSFTWTFYRFQTKKGWVTVKWYGTSNGYYSESVDFREITSERRN
jgi:hypothetical protein